MKLFKPFFYNFCIALAVAAASAVSSLYRFPNREEPVVILGAGLVLGLLYRLGARALPALFIGMFAAHWLIRGYGIPVSVWLSLSLLISQWLALLYMCHFFKEPMRAAGAQFSALLCGGDSHCSTGQRAAGSALAVFLRSCRYHPGCADILSFLHPGHGAGSAGVCPGHHALWQKLSLAVCLCRLQCLQKGAENLAGGGGRFDFADVADWQRLPLRQASWIPNCCCIR